MKKITTLFIAVAMCLFSANAFAQFSAGVGYMNAKFNTKIDKEKIHHFTNGAYVRFDYTFPVYAGLSVVPGIDYHFVTGSYTDVNSEYTIKSSILEQYINLPVDLKYTFDFSEDFKFFVYSDATLSFGLYSKGRMKSSKDGETVIAADFDNYEKESGYSKFDVLAGGGIGADVFGFLRVKAGFDFGLLNRLRDAKIDGVYRHVNRLHIGVAYIF